MSAQTTLDLRLHPRTALITRETVSAVLGLDSDGVQRLVDRGDLRYVFDVSSGIEQRNSELRFWAAEIAGNKVRLPDASVIDLIIGHHCSAYLRIPTICSMMMVSRRQAHRLARWHIKTEVIGGRIMVAREAVVRFLGCRQIDCSLLTT